MVSPAREPRDAGRPFAAAHRSPRVRLEVALGHNHPNVNLLRPRALARGAVRPCREHSTDAITMDYTTLKMFHATTVALSFGGFVARGLASLRMAQWGRSRPAKILPHIVDTLLLISGVWLAVMAHLSPSNAPWLVAKWVALLIYIGLGVVALRPSVPRAFRAAAWVGGLLAFAYIASVAVTKSAWSVWGTA
jgi:uncharacterized membrane protein SirB2